MTRRGRSPLLGTAVAAGLAAGLVAVAGCSSSSGPGPGPSSPTGAPGSSGPSRPSGTPADAATRAAISRAYADVFGTKSTLAQSVAALQHGAVFRAVIVTESAQPAAKGSGARVTGVTLRSPDLADVQFTVISNGQAVLPTTGNAVRAGDHWQVAAKTFCTLLTLQGAAPPACSTPSITALPH